MMKPPERVEIPEGEELRRERFARVLAVLIVIATLGVAAVEYLHSVAEQRADAAGVSAQQLSIERQGELVRADDAARANLDIYAQQQQELTEEGNAFQEYLAPSVVQGSAQGNLLQLEETRWATLASLTGDLTTIKAGGPTSPQQDVYFPGVLLSQSEKSSDRLFALGDAQDQLRADWQGRSGLLSVILTLLAVAIYLFGLSLTLQAHIRRWLVGLGVVLVAVGTVSTVVLQFSNPTQPDDAAATSYANGMYALNTFYTQPGSQGLEVADRYFTQAIQQRPRFAQAYLERSQVRFLIGSPERTNSIVSITTPAALQAQGNDLQMAYELGLRDKLLLNNIAANRLLLAITQGQSSDYGPAMTFLQGALKLDPNDPLLYYNLGLAYLGQGNRSQAQQTYQDAVQHTLYTDVSHRTARNDTFAEELYVGGALTSLDLLGLHRTDLAAQVRAMKVLIVNGVDRNQGPPGSTGTMKITELDVFPAELQWKATIDGVNPQTSNVSTQWYYQASPKLGWSVIGPMSGVAYRATNGVTQYNAVYQNICSGCTSSDYFLINSSLKTMTQCVQPGRYKVEVYINGGLAATASADGSSLPTLKAEQLPELGMDLCHPTAWKQDTTDISAGFDNGFVSPDHTSGAYFFRFQNPEVASGTDPKTEAETFRDEILSVFSSLLLPNGAGTPTIDCGTPVNGTNTLPWGNTLDSSCVRSDSYFLGLTGANEEWYTYSGGVLHIGTGVTSDGAVLGAFSFGPNAQWQSQSEPLPDVVFDSFVYTGQ